MKIEKMIDKKSRLISESEYFRITKQYRKAIKGYLKASKIENKISKLYNKKGKEGLARLHKYSADSCEKMAKECKKDRERRNSR